tara:strand:- start:106 stop:540 length:435 start_codon:yes stop_codon:yes gene_type:complete
MRIKKVHIHKTKDGTKIPIHRLKTDHLVNIIRFAKKNPDNTNKEYLDIYINELRDRYGLSDQLIMNELSRFFSIIDHKDIKCIKTGCDGWLKEYDIDPFQDIRQTFCGTCWAQYKNIGLSEVIQEDEVSRFGDDCAYQRLFKDC